MFKKLRDSLEQLYPSEPIRLVISKTKIFFLFFIIIIAFILYYLRTENKNELKILEQQHKNIQLTIQNYLHDMSGVDNNSAYAKLLRTQYETYKNQLKIIEHDIDSIKKTWLINSGE